MTEPLSGTGSPGATSREAKRSHKARWIALAVVGIWALAVIGDLAGSYRDAHKGLADIQNARSQLSASDLVSGEAIPDLNAATSEFSRAHSLFSSPLLWPIDVLPVFGRQASSVRDLASAAARISKVGVDSIAQSKAILDAPHGAGPARITALQKLSVLAGNAYRQLKGVNPGTGDALLEPIAHAHDELVTQLNQVVSSLHHASESASLAAKILKGPEHYLLLVSNNSEMRAGQGTYLQLGIISTDNGSISLSAVLPTSTLLLPQPISVSGDYEDRWGYLAPGADWRLLGFTPQFNVTAQLAERMWSAEPLSVFYPKIDGVMSFDVAGLQELLTVTGPVTDSSGDLIDSGNVDQILLHDQYNGINYGSSPDTAEVDARQEQMGSIAKAVFNDLQQQSVDLRQLATAMSAATDGRHLMMWSESSSAESVWTNLGVSGTLNEHSLDTSVINQGANKLDYYLRISNSVELASVSGGVDVTLQVHVDNPTPPGQSSYIAGPYPGAEGEQYGEYIGLVAVNIPRDAQNISWDGGPVYSQGTEGPTQMVAFHVQILDGQQAQETVRFEIPGKSGSMTIEPSGRIPAEQWTVNGDSLTDSSAYTIAW